MFPGEKRSMLFPPSTSPPDNHSIHKIRLPLKINDVWPSTLINKSEEWQLKGYLGFCVLAVSLTLWHNRYTPSRGELFLGASQCYRGAGKRQQRCWKSCYFSLQCGGFCCFHAPKILPGVAPRIDVGHPTHLVQWKDLMMGLISSRY